jgi:hypothetical protein
MNPHADWVREAIDLNFGLVMFSDPDLNLEDKKEDARQIVAKAQPSSIVVEGEVKALPGSTSWSFCSRGSPFNRTQTSAGI